MCGLLILVTDFIQRKLSRVSSDSITLDNIARDREAGPCYNPKVDPEKLPSWGG